MEYLHSHKYKLKSSHIDWTRYMSIISSTIYLGQMKTAVTGTSSHPLLAKTTCSNLHKKSKLEGAASSYVYGIYDYVKSKMWWITDICSFSERIHISNIYLQWSFAKNIYLAKKMLTLHARVMEFFDTVEGKHYECAMDNIYNSDAFIKAAYNYEIEWWLMVLRGKEREGLSPSVTQEELKSKKSHIDTRGTAKESVLECYQKFTSLIESSMYDTNHVKYTIMVSEDLKWLVKEKGCFNVDTGKI